MAKTSGEERLKMPAGTDYWRDPARDFHYDGQPPGNVFGKWGEAQYILVLEMAEFPSDIDFHQSIDPYYFLEVQGYSWSSILDSRWLIAW